MAAERLSVFRQDLAALPVGEVAACWEAALAQQGKPGADRGADAPTTRRHERRICGLSRARRTGARDSARSLLAR